MKILIKASTDKEYEAGGETFDGYMGAIGWKGKNADANLEPKDIAKVIRTQFKKKFPGYKISVRTRHYDAIDAIVYLHSNSDIMSREDFIELGESDIYKILTDKYHSTLSYENSEDKWVTYTISQLLREMSDDERKSIFGEYYDYKIGHLINEEYSRNNAGHYPIWVTNSEPVEYVRELLKSFVHDDSNAMVDYYSTNLYTHVYWKLD